MYLENNLEKLRIKFEKSLRLVSYICVLSSATIFSYNFLQKGTDSSRRAYSLYLNDDMKTDYLIQEDGKPPIVLVSSDNRHYTIYHPADSQITGLLDPKTRETLSTPLFFSKP